MSKAFDMVEWGELFVTLKERGVSAIYLRLLIFIYMNQQCDVKWAGKHSFQFTVRNGVRQVLLFFALSTLMNFLFS